MSAKKQQQSPWYNCGRCGQRFLRLYTTKHNDMNCGTIFPVIENGIVISTVSKVPSNSKISQLPFVNSPIGLSTIFLSDAIIQDCGLETFSWVAVKNVSRGDDTIDELQDATPIAFQVWPIPEQQATQNMPHVILTTEAVTFNCISSLSNPVCVQKLPGSVSRVAKIVKLSLIMNNQVQVDEKRFCDNVKRKLRHRIIAPGNCFTVRSYAEVVKVRVQSIQGTNSEVSESSLVEQFSRLDCSYDSDKQYCSSDETFQDTSHYFEINAETRFQLELEHTKITGTSKTNVWTLDCVGGMSSCVDEVCSFIKYVFATPDYGSHGIIIHGQFGTGKTILWEALCNSLSINPIVFREVEQSKESELMFSYQNSAATLEDAFSKAITSQPAAVIIESLDVHASASSSLKNNNPSARFSWKLRSLISNLKNTKVLVIATATNVDGVEPSLRSGNCFGKEVETPIPSVVQREDICRKILNRLTHALSESDIKSIALSTHGFVGADLRGLFSQAAIMLARQNLESDIMGDTNIFAQPFSMDHVQSAMKTVRPSAMKSFLVDVPNVRWDDIGGQKELKFKLKQAIEWPLKHPEAFQRLGITPPKGILMYGPPGCSKTMIAKAIATESGLNFISVKGSELFSKWVGESEKAVQKIFRKAKQVAPCVIFFDEIDSLGGERGSSSSGASNVHERVLAQLLVEIDGVEPLKEVTIVAATNRPDIIDQALLRPGRLDRIIYVPLPDTDAREEILRIWFRKMPVDPIVDVKLLVQLTEGYSGAELTAVCHEAALHALDEDIEATRINDSHFKSALTTVKPRITKEQLSFYEKYSSSLKVL